MEAKEKTLERRLFPRSEVAAIAMIYADNRYHGPYPIRDLSASGARLRIGTSLELPESLEMTLRFTDGLSITTMARLVDTRRSRSQEEEASFAFQHESPDIEDAIQQALLGQLEQSHLSRVVLIVDDSRENCVVLRREVEVLGRTAIVAHTPLDTICWVENPRIRVDTILINPHLRGTGSTGILDYLAEEHPNIKRVLVADGSQDWQGNLAIKSGRAHAYLARPLSRRHLIQVLGATAL